MQRGLWGGTRFPSPQGPPQNSPRGGGAQLRLQTPEAFLFLWQPRAAQVLQRTVGSRQTWRRVGGGGGAEPQSPQARIPEGQA